MLRGRKFFSYDANGIKLQICAALITYLLGKFLMLEAAQRYARDMERLSFQKAMALVRTWIATSWERLWRRRPREKHLDDLIDAIAFEALKIPRPRAPVQTVRGGGDAA